MGDVGEEPLGGGRVTAGVVRVGETVRRPRTERSDFVASLLAHLRARGFDAAPTVLGIDARGRDVLEFIDGRVPPELDGSYSNETLSAAARLIRRYHDATADFAVARTAEVICHNDLSPCNFVFRGGSPVALIDFDVAAPGWRLDDVGYALFLWLNLGTDGPAPPEQARRIRVFCAAYGISADERVVRAVADAVARNLDRLRASGRAGDAEWWQKQLEWITVHRRDLGEALDGDA